MSGYQIEGGGACPEQYEATFDGKPVGYLRLRHGFFRVECPDCGGETVFESETKGDGIFDDTERAHFLGMAQLAIRAWISRQK